MKVMMYAIEENNLNEKVILSSFSYNFNNRKPSFEHIQYNSPSGLFRIQFEQKNFVAYFDNWAIDHLSVHSNTCNYPNGICSSPERCNCSTGVFGLDCNVIECFGYFSNETDDVCSNHGDCIVKDKCKCAEGYEGIQCSEFSCFGVDKDDVNVCSSFGNCTDKNTCICVDGYGGYDCSTPICVKPLNNVIFYDNFVDNKGKWMDLNENYISNRCGSKQESAAITFHDGYRSIISDTFYNFGYFNLSFWFVIGSIDHEECVMSLIGEGIDVILHIHESETINTTILLSLEYNYNQYQNADVSVEFETKHPFQIQFIQPKFTREISNWALDDIKITHVSTTNVHGTTPVCKYGSCVSPNLCECNENYFGSLCDDWECFFLNKNSSNVCSNHGFCQSPNNCVCNGDYFGINCDLYSCFDILMKDESLVCSGNGVCVTPNLCKCNFGYVGDDCSFPVCFGESRPDYICSSHGKCIEGICFCDDGYINDECSDISPYYNCFGVLHSNENVCNQNGVCVSPNNCSCSFGYDGNECNDVNIFCYGKMFNDYGVVCSGMGDCIKNDTCLCDVDFEGENCEKNEEEEEDKEEEETNSSLSSSVSSILSFVVFIIFYL